LVFVFSRLPIGNPVAALGGSGRRESQWLIYDLRFMIYDWRRRVIRDWFGQSQIINHRS
jgi:hypothetical protein